MKQCPNDQENLEKILFNAVEVDYCQKCLGIWFDHQELQSAKNNKDEQLNWVDIDLWRDKSRFEVSRQGKLCPADRTGLMQVGYDDSRVKVDFCKQCHGVWLDRGEFKQIINYLKNKSDYEILNHFTENAAKELWEVFTGPEGFRQELNDFLMLMKLFNYKFIIQHPHLNSLIENAQK